MAHTARHHPMSFLRPAGSAFASSWNAVFFDRNTTGLMQLKWKVESYMCIYTHSSKFGIWCLSFKLAKTFQNIYNYIYIYIDKYYTYGQKVRMPPNSLFTPSVDPPDPFGLLQEEPSHGGRSSSSHPGT